MLISTAAAVDASGVLGWLGAVGLVGLVIGVVYLPAARNRARSRREHTDASITGQGTWSGVINEGDIERFIPEISIGIAKSVFLLSEGVPVRLEVDAQGLRLRSTSRLLKKFADKACAVPWTDVVAGVSRPVGFKSLGGKISPVRQTDVLITIVGDSALPFLDSWDLIPNPDDPPLTADEVAQDADWLQFVQDELGPPWRPDTALLRVRMSAPDGLAETITRWARGALRS